MKDAGLFGAAAPEDADAGPPRDDGPRGSPPDEHALPAEA
jgi:hypothetical protein